MTHDEFKQFIDKQTFRKAVTAQRNPHAYIVKSKTVNGSDEDYDAVEKFIKENGFEVFLWGKPYTVYHLEGHMYWVMGEILNRNNTEDYYLTINPANQYTNRR